MIHPKDSAQSLESVLKPAHPSLIKFPFGKGAGNFIQIKTILEFAAAAVAVDALSPRIALGGCVVRFVNTFSDFIEDFFHHFNRADGIVSPAICRFSITIDLRVILAEP